MSRLTHRLERLEKHMAPVRRTSELVVRYYGDPAPADDDSWTLTVWLHQPECDRPEHPGPCRLKQACHDALV
jgi:hypothetical protein